MLSFQMFVVERPRLLFLLCKNLGGQVQVSSQYLDWDTGRCKGPGLEAR